MASYEGSLGEGDGVATIGLVGSICKGKLNKNSTLYITAKVTFAKNYTFLVEMLKPNAECTQMIHTFLVGLNSHWFERYLLQRVRKRRYISLLIRYYLY